MISTRTRALQRILSTTPRESLLPLAQRWRRRADKAQAAQNLTAATAWRAASEAAVDVWGWREIGTEHLTRAVRRSLLLFAAAEQRRCRHCWALPVDEHHEDCERSAEKREQDADDMAQLVEALPDLDLWMGGVWVPTERRAA